MKLAFDRGRALFPLPLYRILLYGWGSQWVSIGLRPRTIVDIAARLRGLGWTKTVLIGNGSYQVRPTEFIISRPAAKPQNNRILKFSFWMRATVVASFN